MAELEEGFRRNLKNLPHSCQEKLKDGEPLSTPMVCQLFQTLAYSVKEGKTKLSQPLSDLLLLSYKFLTASKIFSNQNGPLNLFKAGTCALVVVLSKTKKYVELEEVYREFFHFVIKNHIDLKHRESEMVIRTMQETTRIERIDTAAYASCPYNEEKAETCRAIIGCQLFVSLIVALHCRESNRKSPASSFISDATAIVLMWIDGKPSHKTCRFVYSSLVSVYKMVSEEEYTRLQDADLSPFHGMMMAFIQLHDGLKSNTSKSCTCANIHNNPVSCAIPGTWSSYCRAMKNMLSSNITTAGQMDEQNGLKDIYYFCRKSFVGILKLLSDSGTALELIPRDLFLSDTKQISTDLIKVFAPEKICHIIVQLSFLHHKMTSSLNTSSTHKKQCFTDAVDFIINTQSFYKVLDSRKEYLLKNQAGICACFLQERDDFGLAEKYLQVNTILLKQYLAMAPLKIEMIAQCCRFSCRILRNKGRFNDAVEMAVEMLKQVSAIESDKLLKFLMDLYFRNKSLLFDQLTKNGKPIASSYVKTICDYLSGDGEVPTTKQQRNFIVKLLFMELKLFAFGCEHPVILYRVLCQLIKYSQPGTSIHTNSSVLLDETLHAWKDKFVKSKLACLPTTDYDSVRGSDVLRTVEDRIAGTSLHWQLQSIASLTNYLREWEGKIQEADQHRSRRMKDKKWEKSRAAGMDSCDWFPLSPPPSFTELKSLANMQFTRFEDLDCFVHHYCNSARAVAYLLRLRGEWISAVQLLTSLEKSLPTSPKSKDLIYYRTAIAIKSDLVEMLLKMNQTKLAMEVATQANDMLLEYERMNHVEGGGEEVAVSKRGPGRYVTLKCKIVFISALVSVDRLREARMEFEAIVDDPFIVIGKSAPVKGYLLSAQVRRLSAKLFVKSCHKNNLDEIADVYNCPVHATLHSYHAIMSLLQEIFPVIMKYNLNYDFDKSSTQSRIKFGQEEWQRDVTFQLELIDVYLDGLSTRVRNSHADGQTRSSLPSIIEGLNVSRLLLLPERELDFQSLLVEHASILRDCDVIHEELLVAADVVQYVNTVYGESGQIAAKRNVLFSKAMESRLKTKADSSSTNETEKQDEAKQVNNNDDDDDGAVDSDDDILSKKSTDFSSMSLVTGDPHCSPRLKNKTKKTFRLTKLELAYQDFLHLSNNLPKSNFFLTQQYTVFLEQCSTFFLRENFLSNVNTCLSSATNVIGKFKQFCTQELHQVFAPDAKGDSNYFDAFLPEMEALVNMRCARAFFQTGKLDKCRAVLSSVFYILGGHVYNYQRKSKLLAEAHALSAYIDLGFGDTTITTAAADKSNVNPNPLLIDYIINSTLTKNGSSSPTRPTKNDDLGKCLKTPTIRKTTMRIFKEKPTAASSQPKVLTEADNLDNTAAVAVAGQSNVVVADEVKTVDHAMFKTPLPKPLVSPTLHTANLHIPNLHTTPIKRTPAKWKKTPLKAKKGAKKQPSGKTLDTLSEFKIFDELLSGDEPINLQGKHAAEPVVAPPPAPATTRTSSRRLRSSCKNIQQVVDMKHQRLRARRKFREANGPYYTDEEAEVERPSKRNTRKKKLSSESDSQGENEMEMERRKSVSDSEHLLPTTTLDADNQLFAMRDLPPHSHSTNIAAVDDEVMLADHRHTAEITTQSPEQQLKKSLKLALASGDFYTAKRAARYLARHHNSSGQIDHSSALHMISIGLSFRSEILFRSFYFLRKIQKMKTNSSIFSNGGVDETWNFTSAIGRVRRDQTITNSDNLPAFMRDVRAELPDDWTILLISHRSVLDDDRENWPIMISKIRGDASLDNLHLQLDSSALPTLKLKLGQIKEDLNSTSLIKEKVQWWTMRRKIDQTIAHLVHDLDHFLGFLAPIVLGSRGSGSHRGMFNMKLKEMRTRLANNPLTKGLISDYKLTMLEVLLEGWNDYSADDKASAICWLFDHQPDNSSLLDEELVKFVCQQFETYKSPVTHNVEKRGHVFLILDKDLHQFPWESMAIMRSHSVSRVPSIDMLRYMLHLRNNQQGYTQADLNKVSYVVDPKGDLTKTGNRFQNWFESIPPWTGVCSQKPSGTQWVNFLEKTDVLIYCGHGSGSQFVSREEVVKSKSKACPMLMGCSSGLLNDEGISEPNGSVLSYLIAGSPCVLSYLWPVTDKDTDRYLARCLNLWSDTGTTLTDVLRPSEKVCKMPMTNGAACIMYGMPVTCIDVPLDWKKQMPATLK